MRKTITIALFCAFVATPALADYSGGQAYSIHVSGYYIGSGGEFTVYYNGIPGLSNSSYADVAKGQLAGHPESFQSFCIEHGENVLNPMNVNVSETFINEATGAITGPGSHAILGGKKFGDNLDSRTAYLYTRFAAGVLSNYAYSGSGRPGSAGTLQKAIWLIEGEVANLTDNTGAFTLTAAQVLQANDWITEAQDAIDSGRWSGIGDVHVLNMWYLDPATGKYLKAQDQLYVPVPAAVLLGMLGIGVAGLKLRKYA